MESVRVTLAGTRSPAPARIGVVLSAGGMRGAAHLGVLRRLIAARLPIDVIVGSSVGAIIGAYYAAAGFTIDDIIADAPRLRLRHLLCHSLQYHAPARVRGWLRARSGIVPARLAALDAARFDRLHHGVTGLGVVCHDLAERRAWYFSTAESHGLALGGVVRASAAVQPLFPPLAREVGGRTLRLVDGGYSDSLPLSFARGPGLEATHLIVSDCRRERATPTTDTRTIWVRPAMRGLGIVRRASFSLTEAVRAGEGAVTDAMIDRARAWLEA